MTVEVSIMGLRVVLLGALMALTGMVIGAVLADDLDTDPIAWLLLVASLLWWSFLLYNVGAML